MAPKAKKVLKITGITLASLIGLVLVAVALVCWIVFKSSNLTGVAGKAIDRYSPARAKIDDVDLTLVGTYPFLGFRLNGLVIYDDMPDSPSDTLAAIDEFTVTVDFKTLYKESKIILTNLFINGVQANVYTAADGRSNLDVFGTSDEEVEEPEPEESDMDIYADLQKISVKNVKASYLDMKSGTDAMVSGIDIDLKGLLNYDSLDAKTTVKVAAVKAAIKNDSTDVAASLDVIRIKGNLSKYSDDVNASLTMSLDNSWASMSDVRANLNDLKLTVDGVSFKMGADGFKDLVTAMSMSASNLSYSSEGMSTETGTIAMKIAKAEYLGDSVSLSGFSFDSRSISLNLEDSLGIVTKAGINKLLLNLDCNLKTDLSNAGTAMKVTLDGTEFYQGGDTAINVITDNMIFSADASVRNRDIRLNSRFATPSLHVTMGDDVYVPGWALSLDLPLETDMDVSRFAVREGANIKVDGQQIGFSASGTLGGQQIVAGRARVHTPDGLDIDHLISMIPDAFKDLLEGIDVHGTVGLDVNIKGAMDDNGPALDRATVQISLDNLDASLNDSIKAMSGKFTADITYPSAVASSKDRETADLVIKASDLEVSMIDSTTINASFDNLSLNASVAGLTDDFNRMDILLGISADRLQADMDTIFGAIDTIGINVAVAPSDNIMGLMGNIAFKDLTASLGSTLSATLGNSDLRVMAQYDESKDDMLLKFNPNVKLTLEDICIDMLKEPVLIPNLDMDFSLGRFNINNCRAQIDNSDLMFWGDIYNIGAYLDGTGLLTGELFLESDYVDVTRLMQLVSADGGEELVLNADTIAVETVGNDTLESTPFIVPKGINLALYTNLAKINFNDHIFNNVGGDVTIKDGVAVLQELGFSSDAAEMQLTAIYSTPSPQENPFIEMDFHLLDIQINELIDLIPSVDSIVPMLKAFSGQANFHFAAETSLRNNMPIMSTLYGAAAIDGKNLTVLDSEVFDGIKRKLLMRKKAQPVIDSLDVQMQVIRNRVTLYPFRIHMDRYTAIIDGRHFIDKNLDCKYNISLIKTPFPIRLGVSVGGSLNDIAEHPLKHIRLIRPRYKKLYEPDKQSRTDEIVIGLKDNIQTILEGNVRRREKEIEN